jgi:hypothetical protein
VGDEYDVQYLLQGCLRGLFDDVRPEDPSPSRAGASTRIDFVLKEEQIVVEAKMTRDGLGERQIADQLIRGGLSRISDATAPTFACASSSVVEAVRTLEMVWNQREGLLLGGFP